MAPSAGDHKGERILGAHAGHSGESARSTGAAAYLAGAAVLTALASLAYLAGANDQFPGDVRVSTWVQALRADWLDAANGAVAFTGVEYVAGAIVIAAALASLLAHGRSAATLIVVASLAGFALRTAVKLAVSRPRPPDELVQVIERADGYSFPSGHVMFYVVLLGTLSLVLTSSGMAARRRLAIQATFAVVLLLMGFSRIYLGAHWMSDVVAGYLFGASVVAAASWAWKRWGAASSG